MGIFSYFFDGRFTKYRGVIDDPRLGFEKDKDWLHEELVYGVDDGGTTFSDIVFEDFFYPTYNQHETSSCVPHAHTQVAGMLFPYFRNDSKEFLYRLRANYPQEGTYPQNLADNYVRFGSPEYDMLPDEEKESHSNMVEITDAMRVEAYCRRMKGYVTVKNPNNIDTLNGIIRAGKGIAVCVYGTFDEWSEKWVEPQENVSMNKAPIRHCIAILPNSGFKYNGKRWLSIQDSALFGGYAFRYISEDWVKERLYNAIYYIDPQYNGDLKPAHRFGYNILSIGSKGEEVAWLQRCLQYEKLFPTQDTNRPFHVTGYFGGITYKAVKDFQVKYAQDILIPAGIRVDEPTGIVGKYTINKLNQLFS